jgi:uncharacterized protein
VTKESSCRTWPRGPTSTSCAAVFGMTRVLDVLVAAGARLESLELASAAGDLSGLPPDRFTHRHRPRALVFAADHQRLDVIDQLAARR